MPFPYPFPINLVGEAPPAAPPAPVVAVKPVYGQPLVVTDGPSFGAQPVDFTTGFVTLVKNTGPRYGAPRVRNTGAYGAPRMQDITA